MTWVPHYLKKQAIYLKWQKNMKWQVTVFIIHIY